MIKKQNTKRLLGLIGLAGTVGGLLPTATVTATPILPPDLEAFWQEAGLEEVEEVVTQTMLEESEQFLVELSSKISNNLVEKEALERTIKQTEKEIEQAEAEIEERITLHERRKEKAISQLQAIQINNSERVFQYVNVLLGSDSLTDAFGRIKAITQITEANQTLMEQIKKEQEELERLSAELQTEKEALNDEKETLEELIEELEEQKEAASKIQEALEEQWEKQEKEKEKLQAEQQRLLEEYQKSIEEERALLERILSENIETYNKNDLDLKALATRKNDPFLSHHIVSNAMGFLGVPYVWGGSTPGGFDCSGLTQYVFRQAGIEIPRVAQDQSRLGERVNFSELEAGDLLFWGAEGSSYHVALYIGNGNYIHAPKPGDRVKIAKMTGFTPDFAKRVLPKNSTKLKEQFQKETTKAPTLADEASVEMIDNIFHVTYYSAYDGTQVGITRMGTNMANGNITTKDGYRIVAVDPNVIPLGTVMRITTGRGETFLGKADDTGGVIKGNKIDIAVSSPSEALSFGRTTAVVEIVK